MKKLIILISVLTALLIMSLTACDGVKEPSDTPDTSETSVTTRTKTHESGHSTEPHKTESGHSPHEIIAGQVVENESLDRFNADNDNFTLSVTVDAAGDADEFLRVGHSGYSYIEDSNLSVVRKIVSIEYDERFDFEKAVITFELSESLIKSPRIFPQGENSGELAGLSRFCLWRWFDEVNMMLPIDADYLDNENKLVIEMTELGDFYIADLDRFYYDMDLIPEGIEYDGESPTVIPPNDPPAFVIPENPPFTIIIDEEATVSRPVIEGYMNLGWEVYFNGRNVLSRAAGTEYRYNYFGTSAGKYEIYVSAFVDGGYKPISNAVTYTIDDKGVMTVENARPVTTSRVADSPEYLKHVVNEPFIITIDRNNVITRPEFDVSGYGIMGWSVYRNGKRIIEHYNASDLTYLCDETVPGYYEVYLQGHLGEYVPISNIVSFVIE